MGKSGVEWLCLSHLYGVAVSVAGIGLHGLLLDLRGGTGPYIYGTGMASRAGQQLLKVYGAYSKYNYAYAQAYPCVVVGRCGMGVITLWLAG